MRVLHLIDAAGPQACAATLALLNESLGRLGRVEQHVLLLGPAALQRAAAAAGVAEASTLAPPFGRALLAWPALRARRGALPPLDLVHCWSLGALALASLRWRGRPRLLTLTTPPSRRDARWLRVLARESPAPLGILPISSTLRRELLTRGVPEPVVHVLRPGLDMGKVAHGSRAALRERWGLPPGAEGDRVRVVALLGDPPSAADALPAMMAVGLADETMTDPAGPRLRLLVHPDQLNRRRAEAMNRHVGKPNRIIQEAALARPWEVLPGCDLALAQGPWAGGLGLLWAMAANVPIVGEATYAVSEIVEDRHSALLARPGQPKALAHRITQLVADKHQAWRLRDTARHEAYSFFSRQRYCQSLLAVYDQLLAGRPIEVPPLPTTGGLRFSGRA